MVETEKQNKLSEVMKDLIDYDWWRVLQPFLSDYRFKTIIDQLSFERATGKKILPVDTDCFKAFKLCPYSKLKVVIVGQEPYNRIIQGKPEGDGLAFSYTPTSGHDLYLPRSLKNILNEVNRDVYQCGERDSLLDNPNLKRWAEQGVLLINASLTTHEGEYSRHNGLWRPFINYLIQMINDYNPGTIVCLWGINARSFSTEFSRAQYILEAAHPEADAFSGCKHFSQINEILKKNNNESIKW